MLSYNSHTVHIRKVVRIPQCNLGLIAVVNLVKKSAPELQRIKIDDAIELIIKIGI